MSRPVPLPPGPAFWRGGFDALPFLLVFLPFGILFGLAGTVLGLSFAQVMGFSAFVVAGAAQFTAVQLMDAHAPTIMVLVTSVAVNLRMAMYSAALAPHLGGATPWQKALMAYSMTDQSFVLADALNESAPRAPLTTKLAYYAGTASLLVPAWLGATLLGALFGPALPKGLALDFAVPVTFLAMIGPSLRSVPHLVATAVSCVAALALVGLPAGTGVLLAAVLAMIAGARTEDWLAHRAARATSGGPK